MMKAAVFRVNDGAVTGCEANGVVVTLLRRQFRVVELHSGK